MSPSTFVSLYRYWTWIGIPVMAVALALLGLLILGVVATVKKAQLLRAPLAERQQVEFAEAGRVVLSIEGPRFSTRFARVNFELRGIDGERIEGRRAWFRAQTSGVSTVRMELLTYDIPRPGRYVLIMTGWGAPQSRDANHAVAFTRPHVQQTVAYIVGIVLASGVFIVSPYFHFGHLLITS